MIAYGARCTWWDDKRNVASKDGTPTGLPCCPNCKGVLFEIEDEAWANGVIARNLEEPGYVEMVAWLRGKCFPTFEIAERAYREAGSPIA